MKFPPAPSCILSASKNNYLVKRFVAFYIAFKTPQSYGKAKMSKINNETLLSGDYSLLQKLNAATNKRIWLSPPTYNSACLCPYLCQLLDPPLTTKRCIICCFKNTATNRRIWHLELTCLCPSPCQDMDPPLYIV